MVKSKQGTMDLEELFTAVDDFVSAIYKNKTSGTWTITSDILPSEEHFEKPGGPHRFAAETLGEALEKFYAYLRKTKKV